jgi:hypothetical protein
LALIRITARVAEMAWNNCRVGSRTCWDFLRWTLFCLSERACYTRGAPGEHQGGGFRRQYFFPSASFFRFIRWCCPTTYLDYSDRFSTAQEKSPCRHRIDRFPHGTCPVRFPLLARRNSVESKRYIVSWFTRRGLCQQAVGRSSWSTAFVRAYAPTSRLCRGILHRVNHAPGDASPRLL